MEPVPSFRGIVTPYTYGKEHYGQNVDTRVRSLTGMESQNFPENEHQLIS
jgi:hypothetical protein